MALSSSTNFEPNVAEFVEEAYESSEDFRKTASTTS